VPISKLRLPGSASNGLPARTLKKLRAGMARDGAVAFENLFTLPLLKRLRRDVMRRHESGELRENGLVRDIGGRYAAVIPFAGPFLSPGFYANPVLHETLGALLGASYCIGSLEAVIAEPGAGEQHQHIDGPLRFDRAVGKAHVGYRGDLSDLPPYAVTLCVPLCDVDTENGPTAIWRGSHRTALQARPPGRSAVAREFPAEHMVGPFGNSFLFDFRVFHGGMPNHTREPRPVLMFVFTRSWFRDPNLADVIPSVLISKRDFARVPENHRGLFKLAPAARRTLWEGKKRQ